MIVKCNYCKGVLNGHKRPGEAHSGSLVPAAKIEDWQVRHQYCSVCEFDGPCSEILAVQKSKP
jgi:hypothetical protein